MKKQIDYMHHDFFMLTRGKQIAATYGVILSITPYFTRRQIDIHETSKCNTENVFKFFILVVHNWNDYYPHKVSLA